MATGFRKIVLSAVLLLVFASFAAASVRTLPAKRILYLNSGDSSSSWCRDNLAGLCAFFAENELPAEVDRVDLALTASAQPSSGELDELARRLRQPYDLVIALDQPAAGLFFDGSLKLPPGMPLLFCGYQPPAGELPPLPEGASGLTLSGTILKNLEQGMKFWPETRKIAVLTGGAPDGARIHSRVRGMDGRFLLAELLPINAAECSTDEMLRQLAALPANSFVVFDSWSGPGGTEAEAPESLLRRITGHYSGPVLLTRDHSAGTGALGGWFAAGSSHGREVAAFAARLPSGNFSGTVPAVLAGRVDPAFDSGVLQAFGVPWSRLPAGSRLLNSPEPPVPSAGGGFGDGFAAAAVFLGTSAVFLLLLFLQRRRCSRRMAALLESLPFPAGAVEVDRGGRPLRGAGVTAPAGLPVPFEEPVREAFRSGRPVAVEAADRRSRTEFVRLPKSAFPRDAVLWVSNEGDELAAARRTTLELSRRFERTLQSIGDGVIVADANGVITMVNPVTARLVGCPAEELVGSRIGEKYRMMVPGTDLPFDSPGKEVLESGNVASGEFDLVSPARGIRRISFTIAPIFDDDGRGTGIVAVGRDVTEEYEKNNCIRRQKELLESAAEMANMGYFTYSSEHEILEMGGRRLFWGRHADGSRMSVAEWVAPEDVEMFLAAWNQVVSGELTDRSIVYRADIAEGPGRFFESRFRGERRADGGRLDIFGIIRDVTGAVEAERREAGQKEELYKINFLLNTIVENLPCALWIKDAADGNRYVLNNPANSRLVGVENPKDMIGKTDFDFHPPELAQKYTEDDMRVIASGERFDCDETVRTRDGELRYIRTTKLPLKDSGDGRKLHLGLCFDITELVLSRNEQRRTNLLLSGVMEQLPCLLYIKDADDGFRYRMVNREFCQIFGRAAEQVTGRDDEWLFGPSGDLEQIRRHDLQVVESGRGIDVTEEICDASGRRLIFHSRKSVVTDPDGHRLLLGISMDVTRQTDDQNKLTRANLLLQAVLDQQPSMVSAKDAADGFRYVIWNRTCERLTGIPASEALGRTDREIDCYRGVAEHFLQNGREVVATGNGMTLTEELAFRGGNAVTLRTLLSKVEIPGGNDLLLIVASDVTEEVRMTEERQRLIGDLRAFAEQERLVNYCLEAFVLNEESDEGAVRVLQAVCEHLKGSCCRTVRYDFENNLLIPEQEWAEPGRKPFRGSPGTVPFTRREPWYIAFRNGETVYGGRELKASEVLPDHSDADPSSGDPICSGYMAQIRSDGHLWGHLSLFYRDKPYEFTEHDYQLLRAAVHIIEIILSRRRSRARLERSEYEKRLIMDSLRIPLLLFSPDLKLLRVNGAAVRAAGVPESQVCREECFRSFCGASGRPEKCPLEQTRMDLREHRGQCRIRGRDYQETSYPIVVEGKLAYILVTLIDMTDSNESQRQLARALTESQNTSKAKSEFLATMSHELRTPLNAVLGFSELLRKDDVSAEERVEYLNSIHLAGDTLLNLINDILDLSKIEAEQMKIVPEPVDLAMLGQELLAIFRQKADEKQLEFRVEASPGLPVLLLDGLRLRQILLNLTGNALKFTSRGWVHVTIGFEEAAGGGEGTLSIAVGDTGIGVEPEARERIFNPFVQQDAMRDARVFKGTGLGLAISRRLAERMNGGIRLESEPGRGSVFTLVLEHVAVAEQPEAARESSGGEKELEIAGIHALIVDDVAINRRVLAAMLRKEDARVSVAESGEQVLELLAKELPDVVLSDLWMPGMNGEELARKIRSNPAWDRVPIIAVTADMESRNNFRMEDFDGILLKPISMEKMRLLLARLKNGFDRKNPSSDGTGLL